MRRALRVLLTSRQEEWQRFDELFEAYWLARGRVRDRLRAGRRTTPAGPSRASGRIIWVDGPARPTGGAAEHADDAAGDGEGRLVASARRRCCAAPTCATSPIRRRCAEAERIAYRLARAIRYRLSRRWRIARRGRAARPPAHDPRATSRSAASLCCSLTRARPERPLRLVVLLDVSGSMQPYAASFLQFVKGLVASWRACRCLPLPHPPGAGDRRATRARSDARR